MSGLRVDVADLLNHPGARREILVSQTLPGLAGSAARVEAPVELALTLERASDGIVARGAIHATWTAECSTCLRELTQTMDLRVDEFFEPRPVDGETYPIAGHELDLEQLVRDSVMLDLPLAPRCDTPCAPDDAAARAAKEAAADPRWAALSELEL